MTKSTVLAVSAEQGNSVIPIGDGGTGVSARVDSSRPSPRDRRELNHVSKQHDNVPLP